MLGWAAVNHIRCRLAHNNQPNHHRNMRSGAAVTVLYVCSCIHCACHCVAAFLGHVSRSGPPPLCELAVQCNTAMLRELWVISLDVFHTRYHVTVLGLHRAEISVHPACALEVGVHVRWAENGGPGIFQASPFSPPSPSSSVMHYSWREASG